MGSGPFKSLPRQDKNNDFNFLHQQISSYPPLTFEEERQLLRIIHLDKVPPEDDPEGEPSIIVTNKMREDARSKFIAHNLRLVVHNALQKREFYEDETLDLIDEGVIGLSKAIDKFDLNKIKSDGTPYKFSTYGTWWIKCTIHKELTAQFNKYKMGRTHLGKEFDRNRALLRLITENPTDDEVFEFSRWSAEQIKAFQEGGDYVHTQSFYGMQDEDCEEENMMNHQEDPGMRLLKQERHMILKESIQALDPLEATVVVFHTGLFGAKEHTFKRLSTIFHKKLSTIKNNHLSGLKKLYRWLYSQHHDSIAEYL